MFVTQQFFHNLIALKLLELLAMVHVIALALKKIGEISYKKTFDRFQHEFIILAQRIYVHSWWSLTNGIKKCKYRRVFLSFVKN